MSLDVQREIVLLRPEHFHRLGEAEFGVPGLLAIETIGPFVPLQQLGPLLMVHDAYWDPRAGIGHHPHRSNERLFYILKGRVHHDDALNGVRGVMEEGDLVRLTEGRRGMLHEEWNHEPSDAHAFILVYQPTESPPVAEFAPLRSKEILEHEERSGVRTRELVGEGSAMRVRGDVRHFADSSFAPGASLPLRVGRGEAALLYPLEGSFALGEERFAKGEMALVLARERDVERELRTGEGGRLMRVRVGL